MNKQERFDELRNLVLQINEVDTAQQNELINQFSQKLDEALQSDFNFAEFFHKDYGIENSTIQFIVKDSKNQKLIETFLEKLLDHTSESNYMQHILDNIKYFYNLHSTKAFFTLIERKGLNAEGKDELALNIVKHLRSNVIETKGNRKQQHRNENNLDELNKAKEVLEYFNSIVKGEEVLSLIELSVTEANEHIKREEAFAEITQPPDQLDNHNFFGNPDFQTFSASTYPASSSFDDVGDNDDNQPSTFCSRNKGKIAFGVVGLFLLTGSIIAASTLGQPLIGAAAIGAMVAGAIGAVMMLVSVLAITTDRCYEMWGSAKNWLSDLFISKQEPIAQRV